MEQYTWLSKVRVLMVIFSVKMQFDNGSIAVITDNPETLGRFILVKDTYDALLKIASHHHKQINPKTIAITGSNGKTSVKR